MNKKQYTFNILIIGGISLLISSMISFVVCEVFDVRLSYFPFVLLVAYIIIQLLYHLCLYATIYVIDLICGLKAGKKPQPPISQNITLTTGSNAYKKMDRETKKMSPDQKNLRLEEAQVQALLRYTQETFQRFDFTDQEIIQVCECVSHFVQTGEVLNFPQSPIKKRANLTQIALKNFAWNIACPYKMSSDATAHFVMATFSEWFVSTSFETVRKNLRTTIGTHAIMIDENIVFRYLR